jgi:tetratricopeptide (TPR) repeat protein
VPGQSGRIHGDFLAAAISGTRGRFQLSVRRYSIVSGSMSDIFISYAREERDRAAQMAAIFAAQKWTVWWDKVIPPGRKYADVIAEELAAANAIIVLWSPAAVNSDWVKDEAGEGARRKRLIPALIEPTEIPYGFRQLQTADLTDWDGSPTHSEMQGLLQSVARLIDKPAVVADRTAIDRAIDVIRRYRLVAAVVLVALLGVAYAAYKFTDADDLRADNPPADAAEDSPRVSREARIAAAKLTADGLSMIDPGGNHAGAILMFNEAIATDAEYADAYFYRGQSFVALRQNERALADFQKAIALSTDEFTRQQARQFILQIESPAPAPAGAASQQVQVREMFAVDKTTRVAGTTRLILEKRQDPAAVSAAIAAARRDPANKSGVINTLVFLESVDRAVLRPQRPEIERLFEAIKDNGPETTDHIKKLQAILNR